jgi:cell pole-organizing protein PopZ
MSQPAKAQEPSMEEILASIRRIISDDEPGKAAPAPVEAPAAEAKPAPSPAPSAKLSQTDVDATLAKPAPPAEPAPADDILDLTEAMAAAPEPAAPPPAAPNFRTIDGQSDVVFSESEPETPRPDMVAEARQHFAERFNERSLMSAATSSAVDSAFNTLAHTVLVQNARTLEDLVKEMLRPMLRSWLDDNLPPLVERLVRAEIDRVSRGRG